MHQTRTTVLRAGSEAGLRLEAWLTRLALAATLAASVLLAADLAVPLAEAARRGGLVAALDEALFTALVYALIYGSLVYHLARLGQIEREAAWLPVPEQELERFHDGPAPALAILVPSYREEARVVRQTLLSAALQGYPRRRIVLLIDDPPRPDRPADAARLAAARRLPDEIAALLRAPAARFEAELAAFLARQRRGELRASDEARRLGELYEEAAAWLERWADAEPAGDHVDRFFVERVLRAPAGDCRARADAFGRHADGAAPNLAGTEIARAYRCLAALFRAEIGSFERKRYANLSHEPNKAMNLNSYIACVGRSFREEARPDGPHLLPAAPHEATWSVPEADYLLTLDADSLLLPGYASRLIHHMEQPGNERLAVVQTPYCAVPGAPGALERTAGATTDIQLLLHQGFTRYGATFWVGANALLRRAALEDIREVAEERGHPVVRYIQDRTVIEDTESTIDLVAKGWALHNYPARLAYSATPPDFGSLLIQRRRWANGGLLILPKLLRHVARRPSPRRLLEGFVRVHYLGSLAWGSLGLPLLLLFPFDEALDSVWLPLTAAPYFLLYGRDLVRSGYGWRDLPRVYALNLLLVPVHLGGVLKSLQQACTGRRTPFGRTPKVKGRTAAPAGYVLAVGGLVASCAVALVSDALGGRYAHAAFSVVNGLFFGYALVALVGLSAAAEDVRAGLTPRLSRLAGRVAPSLAAPPRARPVRAPLSLASAGRRSLRRLGARPDNRHVAGGPAETHVAATERLS